MRDEMRLFRWLYKLPLRIRSLFRGAQVDRELEEEIAYHIDRATDANVAAGMTPRAARTAALRELGGVTQRMEECRETRRVSLVTDIVRDIRYGARILR